MKNFLKKIIISILQREASLVLRKYNPKIVAIIGSVGKTTTKDVIYAVLAPSFYVRKSEKSFNSEIGIPLTILGCENGWSNPFIWIKNILKGLSLIIFKTNYPQWLVLEVGVDRSGDMDKLNKWLKTDVVVVSRFAKIPVHVEFFKSPEAIIEEKKKILKNLKEEGLLVLNYDDEDVVSLKKEFKGKIITFGLNEGSAVLGSNINIFYEEGSPAGINFKIDYSGSSIPVKIFGVLGRQHIYPVLAAISVGVLQDISIISMANLLSDGYDKQLGRMRLIRGIKNSIIVDDSYNSSPVAVEEAVNTLKDIVTKGRKIFVLGDMMELGKYSVDEHKRIGRISSQVCDMLVTVGLRARDIAAGALVGGLSEDKILQFETSKEAGAYLQNIIKDGDIILVKASQSIRAEKTVEEIMEHPEDKERLLVRQEKEWLVK